MSPFFANGDVDGDVDGDADLDSNDVSDVDALVEGYANELLGSLLLVVTTERPGIAISCNIIIVITKILITNRYPNLSQFFIMLTIKCSGRCTGELSKARR